MSTDHSDFTQGSILKKLSLFMLPVLGALILQAAYGAVDLLVVGRFGSTAGLSAVSTGSQILNLVTFVVTQLAMGVTVLIARYLGEKRPEQISADADCDACEKCAVERSVEKTMLDTVRYYDTVSERSRRIIAERGSATPALLPVWLMTTVKEGKTYTFAVNGQTGKL